MPDLRFALESALLKRVMNLPVRVQRRLVRRPVELDGQVLAPELQLMLRLQKLARTPAVETMLISAARAELVRQSRLVGGEQPIAALRELQVDGAGGPIPARLYTPT